MTSSAVSKSTGQERAENIRLSIKIAVSSILNNMMILISLSAVKRNSSAGDGNGRMS